MLQKQAEPEVIELASLRPEPEWKPAPPPKAREISLHDLAQVLTAEWRSVATVAAGVLALAVVYLLVAPRIYEADVVIRVEEKSRSVAGLEEVAALLGEKSAAEVEIEVIRSRRLVGSVVDLLRLDVGVQPVRFPLVGESFARGHLDPEPAPPWLGLESYAWGGERLRLVRITVPEELLGEPMELTALGGGRFRLSAGGGQVVADGQVGTTAAVPAGTGRVEVDVSELVARPGTRFLVTQRRRDDVVDELLGALRAEERGKKSGIVVVTLEGRDPARVAAVLDALSEAYLRADVDRRSADAQRALEFLEAQLPALRANLEQAEGELRTFQARKGTVSIPVETQQLVAQSAELERELSALEMQRTDARRRFTSEHPEVAVIDRKVEALRGRRALMETRLRILPTTELEAARLERNAKVASEIYLPLLAKVQELRLVRTGFVGNSSIVDPARRPRQPARPRPTLVLVLATLLGVGAGAATVLARRTWAGTARDADEIEWATGLPVYAGIPHSAKQEELERKAQRLPEIPPRPLSVVAPDDPAVEQLRSLRTMLHFTLANAPTKIVALSSPAPGTGKSFVCMNLAHLLADSGWKVLLVDADLRRGQLHRHFSIPRENGLAELITGKVSPDEAIRATPFENLFLLPSGRVPERPAELLQSQNFRLVLEDASKRFDLVIVDTPPVLAVTDPLLVAWNAGLTLLVLRAGQMPMRDILRALRQFAQNRIRVEGTILNDLRPGMDRYGSGRHYEYRSARS
jgi:tyrosine-protein kinase Etk/Wzc